MTTLEVAHQLVELCKAGKYDQCMEKLYGKDIVSIEAAPGAPERRGLAAVAQASKAWADTHTIHSATVNGPWPHGDKFIVQFVFDVTDTAANKRMKLDEMGLYTVANDKIVREEFFYTTG